MWITCYLDAAAAGVEVLEDELDDDPESPEVDSPSDLPLDLASDDDFSPTPEDSDLLEPLVELFAASRLSVR